MGDLPYHLAVLYCYAFLQVFFCLPSRTIYKVKWNERTILQLCMPLSVLCKETAKERTNPMSVKSSDKITICTFVFFNDANIQSLQGATNAASINEMKGGRRRERKRKFLTSSTRIDHSWLPLLAFAVVALIRREQHTFLRLLPKASAMLKLFKLGSLVL